jgi:uncharacterized protein (TIGR00369 family)
MVGQHNGRRGRYCARMQIPDGWDPDTLRELIEEHIPFNKYLGLKLTRISDDGVTLSIPFREEFVGDPIRPALHGGVISMLIDTAGGAATYVAAKQLSRVSTVDLVVDYLRAGPLADIHCHARVKRRGNRVCIVMCDVVEEGGEEPFAQGRGVYNIAPFK